MVISLAQVVVAMATGAMLPVTALLAVEMHRLRQPTRASREPAAPLSPERGAEGADPVEAIARLAAARFDLAAQDPDDDCAGEVNDGPRSRAHLTLVSRSSRPARKRSASAPASDARRPLGYRSDGAPRTHRPVRRD